MSEFDLKTDDQQPEKKPEAKRDFDIDTKDNGAGKGGNLAKVGMIAGAVAAVAVVGYVGLGMIGGGAGGSMAGPKKHDVLDDALGGEGAFSTLIAQAQAVESAQENGGVVWHPIDAQALESELLAAAERVANAEKIERFIEEVGESQLDSSADAFVSAIDEKLIADMRKWAGDAHASAATLDVVAEAYRQIVINKLDILERGAAERRLQRISGVQALLDMALAFRESDGILSEQAASAKQQVDIENMLLDSRDSDRDSAATAIAAALAESERWQHEELANKDPSDYVPVVVTAESAESLTLSFYEPLSDYEKLLHTFEAESGEVIGWYPPFNNVHAAARDQAALKVSGVCANGETFEVTGEVSIWGNTRQHFFNEAECIN